MMGMGILVFLAGLILFSWLGTYNRYWADDWCYYSYIKNLGFGETLRGYFYITTYNSNRSAMTLFQGILYSLGVFGNRILASFIIGGFVTGIVLLLRSIKVKYTIPRWYLFLISVSFVFFLVYLAPNRFQSIYWASGTLTYTMPLLFILLLLAWNLYQPRYSTKTSRVAAFSISFIIAFIGGQFSEAGATVMFFSLIWALLILYIFQQAHEMRENNLSRLLWISLAGVTLALIVMIVCPSNKLRQAGYGVPSSFLQTILLSARFAWDFIFYTLRGRPLPIAFFILINFTLGYFYNHLWSDEKITLRDYTLHVLTSLMIGYTLIASSHVPSAYIEHSPPADRSQIISLFIFLGILAYASWITGTFLNSRLRFQWTTAAVLFVLLLAYGYCVYVEIKIFRYESPRFQKIARVWDERNEKISAEIAQGNRIIDVRAIDSAYLSGILELSDQPNWVNNCAAYYYGVEEIRASLPWDE